MKPARPPRAATPAAVLPAEPPLISRAGPHMVVEPGRLLGVDQAHHALGQALALEEVVVAIGDDVDDRIADGEHVEADVGGHSWAFAGGKAGALGGGGLTVNHGPRKAASRHLDRRPEVSRLRKSRKEGLSHAGHQLASVRDRHGGRRRLVGQPLFRLDADPARPARNGQCRGGRERPDAGRRKRAGRRQCRAARKHFAPSAAAAARTRGRAGAGAGAGGWCRRWCGPPPRPEPYDPPPDDDPPPEEDPEKPDE